jgi:DNA polymerase-3 subunit epsilon
MKIDRPIAVIDLETTGPDPVKDRIIELGVVTLVPDAPRKEWSRRFNPGVPIPPEASAIHGITDANVAGCPLFVESAIVIWKALQGKDLAGYNLRRFDLPLLDEELRRAGKDLNLDLSIDLSSVHVIDAFGIFTKKCPRKLEDAVRQFCGREHDGAHGALTDASATADVIEGQLAAYADLREMTAAELATFSQTSDQQYVDLGGKLYRDVDGDLRYAFGKHKDTKVKDELSFARWMFTKAFPESTCDALRAELERIKTAKRTAA